MDLDTKYRLVKDVVKYSSNDQGDEFIRFFKNDDDISQRYKELLDALK